MKAKQQQAKELKAQVSQGKIPSLDRLKESGLMGEQFEQMKKMMEEM